MYTYQDYERAGNKVKFISDAIEAYRCSSVFHTALEADEYNKQKNTFINGFCRKIFNVHGWRANDFTASNNKIANNFFHILNTQRNNYLLGNGVFFKKPETKEKLGKYFDKTLRRASYCALIHGVSFLFWNLDRLHYFKATEFVPFFDEETGRLRAGVRFWKIAENKPMFFVLYEESGFSKWKFDPEKTENPIVNVTPKQAYKRVVKATPADGDIESIGKNYSQLPIIPLYGSELHQSTLIGMKDSLDSYDLISSGFANDLEDCAQIYWLLENYDAMTDKDLEKFRARLKLTHIASVDNSDGAKVTPFTQEIPHEARGAFLDRLKTEIWDDFGGVKVWNISGGNATATEIKATYQPLDDTSLDFEDEITTAIESILDLAGIDDDPVYKRNKIINELEATQSLLLASSYIDRDTLIKKLPFLTADEVRSVVDKLDDEEARGVRVYDEFRREETESTGATDRERVPQSIQGA